MAIAPQTAMTEERARPRPPIVHSPHQLVPFARPRPARTLAKIAGLVGVAALGTAFAVAIVAGSALFLLLSLN